jgi:hypothetical protein
VKKTSINIFSLLTLFSAVIYGQETSEFKGFKTINESVIRAQLEFLSSDWMEGRRAGDKGELLSSDYIASMLRLYGVKPWGDDKSYFQKFTLIKSTPGAVQRMKLTSEDENTTKEKEFTYGVDFSLWPPYSAEIKAPVVFAGYALISKYPGANELSGLDVSGKFILKIAGFPAWASGKLSPEEMKEARDALDRFAMENGAAGIIEFNPTLPVLRTPGRDLRDPSPSERNPRPADVYSEYSIAGSEQEPDLLRIVVSSSVAEAILEGTEVNYRDYINKAGKNEKYVIPPLENKLITIKTQVGTSAVNVRNVLGIIEGNNTKEFIVLGAHYDHMGSNNGYIWNGADDNASGTVGVMTLAKAFMETGKKPEKSIVIALWTAEEEGLLGSRYFVESFDKSSGKIILNVNFDMISRYVSEEEKNKAVMTYSSSQAGFREMTAGNLKKYGIDLDVNYQPSDNPPGGSDHRSFVAAGIPVMRFKPGHREEYHTPADEISTIDWDIMEKIIRISYANIWQLANSK